MFARPHTHTSPSLSTLPPPPAPPQRTPAQWNSELKMVMADGIKERSSVSVHFEV